MNRRAIRRAIQVGWAAIAVGVALASPGPVSVNAAPATLIPNGKAAAAHQVLLSGTAMQGPMVASTVTAYAVDPATGADLQVLGTAKTDASGNFTVKILSRALPLRLAVTGGSFISEADGSTVSQPRRVTVLLPGAISDISGISINPLTRFVNALTIGRLQNGHTTFAAALANATATIESYYSLSTDPGRLLPDYTVAGIGTDAGKLGLILGALINEDQHLCLGSPGELVTALALDIVSGVFNGRYAGLPVPYCGGALPAIAGTSDFQDALAGVQQLQYVTSAFALGGLYGPAGNILINQAPPVTPDLLVPSVAAITAAIATAAGPPPSPPSPPLDSPRQFPAVALLTNGKVLIAGGNRNTTELYDPADNSFVKGPVMHAVRVAATATTLLNGKVLIAGGDGNGYTPSTAEIYNPWTNSFARGPTMTAPRSLAFAARLPSGKVLIAGGNPAVSSTDIYDPTINSFTVGPSMSVPRQFAAGAKLPGGRVIIAGGEDSNPTFTTTDIYDPVTNSFSPGPSMSNERQLPTATLLPNGKVLIAGGLGLTNGLIGFLNSSDIFDPSTNTISAGPDMNVGRTFATAVCRSDGKVLIFGGGNLSGFLNSSEIYDPVANSFAVGPSLSAARDSIGATLLPNGRVLAVGGYSGDQSGMTSTDLFSP
jgi:hypothetical protein